MENVITEVSASLTPTALWGVVGNVIPLVTVLTLFAFGFYLVRRLIKVKRIKNGGM